MAQAGLHGVAGICLSRHLAPVVIRGDAARKAFVFGFVLGNLLPDTDFFLLGPWFLVNARQALTLHRTWSHSILVIALVTLLLWAWRRREPGGAGLALGAGLGMLLHSLVDMLVWFSAVDFLWPLGYLGVSGVVYLWSGIHVPALVRNFMGAADYLAFALFFLYLGALARRAGTDTAFLPRLRLFTNLNWIFLAVFTALGVTLTRSQFVFEVAHYAFSILVFFPISLYVVVKMRRTIEQLAFPVPRAGRPAAVS